MSRRCLFLDRDGVINRAPGPGAYVLRWEDFVLVPAVADWIRLFKALDYLAIVVTNQQCVAKGLVPLSVVEEMHARMRAELRRCGAELDDVYCCPHLEGTCDCRKPRPGMIHAAAAKWQIDLGQSLLLGDSDIDRQLAANCGVRFLLVRDGQVVAPCP